MKKIFFILFAFALIPAISHAGIPISEKGTDVKKEQLSKSETPNVISKKEVKKLPFLKRLIKKLKSDNDAPSGSSTLNWLSLTLAILALLSTAVGGGLLGIPMAIAAVILGIMGLKKKRPLRGMGIAGIAIGGGLIFLWILLVVIIAAILL